MPRISWASSRTLANSPGEMYSPSNSNLSTTGRRISIKSFVAMQSSLIRGYHVCGQDHSKVMNRHRQVTSAGLAIVPTKFRPRVISISNYGTETFKQSGGVGYRRGTEDRAGDCAYPGARGGERGGELQPIPPRGSSHRKRNRPTGCGIDGGAG